jgi:hypothetical protein
MYSEQPTGPYFDVHGYPRNEVSYGPSSELPTPILVTLLTIDQRRSLEGLKIVTDFHHTSGTN